LNPKPQQVIQTIKWLGL